MSSERPDPDVLLAVVNQEEARKHRGKLKLFREFAGMVDADVPDPYYGAADGFEQVLDMVEAASRGLLDHVRNYLRVST